MEVFLQHDRTEKSYTASTSRSPIHVWDSGRYLQYTIFPSCHVSWQLFKRARLPSASHRGDRAMQAIVRNNSSALLFAFFSFYLGSGAHMIVFKPEKFTKPWWSSVWFTHTNVFAYKDCMRFLLHR